MMNMTNDAMCLFLSLYCDYTSHIISLLVLKLTASFGNIQLALQVLVRNICRNSETKRRIKKAAAGWSLKRVWLTEVEGMPHALPTGRELSKVTCRDHCLLVQLTQKDLSGLNLSSVFQIVVCDVIIRKKKKARNQGLWSFHGLETTEISQAQCA